MASIKEINRKAEQLIEQGNKAQQAVKACQARVVALSSEVVAARVELADASQTDEEGNTVGDVAAAQARLNMIEDQLKFGQRALDQANAEVERINSEKETQVQEINKHNEVSKANLEKLSKLNSMAFSENAEGLSAGIVELFNEAEDARVALLRSMGREVSPSYIRVNREGASSVSWDGGGVSSFDGFDKEQHDSGRGVGSFSTPVTAAAASAAIGASGSAIASGRVSSSDQDGVGTKKLFGSLGDFFGFGRKKDSDMSTYGDTIDFNGFILGRNGKTSDKYYVKGNNFGKFCDFSRDEELYENRPVNEFKTIEARDIEGVYIGDNDVKNRHFFWNRGQDKQYSIDSEEYFLRIASRIPEVRNHLENGGSPYDFEFNSEQEACYNLYFAKPVEVSECDGFYVFEARGRHRVMAAQKLGYQIPVNVVNKRSRSLNKVTSYEEISDYLFRTYEICMDSRIYDYYHLDFETVKLAVSGVESIINEYPVVGEYFVRAGLTGFTKDTKTAVMACTGNGFDFNPNYFADKDSLIETCRLQSSQRVWVRNSTPVSLGAHEGAHGIEWALIQANPKYRSDREKEKAWVDCTEAKEIVMQACQNIRMTPYGMNKTNNELISSISLYAMQNRSETMAEAYADIEANGDGAQPLSKEIKRITDERLKAYKGGY